MPYNTTAIPPRKEPTGQTQLPLSRVKKIISQDADVAQCSNAAAFVITCATEMFIQHLAEAALNQAKTERKPRRNIQYKDIANAVAHQDNLEFLEDVVPKTVPLKKVQAAAREARARLRRDKAATGAAVADDDDDAAAAASAPPQKSASLPSASRRTNGAAPHGLTNGRASVFGVPLRVDPARAVDNPSEQLESEMRQATRAHDGDVSMSG